MLALNIILAIVASVMLLGVIAERDINITIAFVTIVALIIALNIGK